MGLVDGYRVPSCCLSFKCLLDKLPVMPSGLVHERRPPSLECPHYLLMDLDPLPRRVTVAFLVFLRLCVLSIRPLVCW